MAHPHVCYWVFYTKKIRTMAFQVGIAAYRLTRTQLFHAAGDGGLLYSCSIFGNKALQVMTISSLGPDAPDVVVLPHQRPRFFLMFLFQLRYQSRCPA